MTIFHRLRVHCFPYMVTASLFVSTWAVAGAGELKVATIFSDHLVLQRDKPVPVWGWADAGEMVTVEFAGQKQTAVADAVGKWMAKLEPMKANAQPQEMIVRGAEKDRQRAVKDILVGEVWLGSGQSNMAMTVARSNDFEAEKAAAKLPLIRMFKEESGAAQQAQADSRGSWLVCSPENVGGFSATLYFFGRELYRELNVPIGLVNSSVGGTPIESWVAADVQQQIPELKAATEKQLADDGAFDEAEARSRYERALARWKKEAAEAKSAGKPAPRRPTDPLATRQRRGGPGGLFNGKIAPLIPFAIRGILWYQGEANAQPDKSKLYGYQLSALVTDWRRRWGEELPIAWVQLPNFERNGEDWMQVREAMLETLKLHKTGMAITVDIGDPKDIHPKNKQDVGRRLAMWALGSVYGKAGAATSGPLPIGHEIRGSEVAVTFDHADGGLVAKGGPLTGFEIAGENRRWKPASARIDGDTVIVSSPEVKKPVAVRYAWAADPKCNLFNGKGLPASPLRTDKD